jgi:hypothetical protein
LVRDWEHCLTGWEGCDGKRKGVGDRPFWVPFDEEPAVRRRKEGGKVDAERRESRIPGSCTLAGWAGCDGGGDGDGGDGGEDDDNVLPCMYLWYTDVV